MKDESRQTYSLDAFHHATHDGQRQIFHAVVALSPDRHPAPNVVLNLVRQLTEKG